MLELKRQDFDALSFDGRHGISLVIQDKCYLRVQFDRGDVSQCRQFFQRLRAKPPTVSQWSSFDGVIFLWDRPSAFVSFCDPSEHQRWLACLEQVMSPAHAPVVTPFDGQVLISLTGAAVDDLLSCLCGYDFHVRSHAHLMTTRLGDVRVRILLDQKRDSGRHCRLVVDRSHLHYVYQLIEDFFDGNHCGKHYGKPEVEGAMGDVQPGASFLSAGSDDAI
jgi:sarcosine oxidase gamma subunit